MGKARVKVRSQKIVKSDSLDELELFKSFVPELWVDENDNVVYEENSNSVIKFASLARLIIELTLPDRGDIQFMKTLIFTYHSFTTPDELIKLLAARYNVPLVANLPQEQVKAIQFRVVNTIKFWLKTRFDDFSPDSLALVWEIVARLARDGQSVHESLTKLIQKQLHEATIPKALEITRDHSAWLGDLDPSYLLFEVSVDVMSLHMAVIEFDIFNKVKPPELMNSAWTKPALQHRSPHVIQLISRFNAVSYWVASSILWQEKLQDRVKLLAKFIDLAAALDKINSFNSMLEIISGINNSSVRRLRFTFGELSRRHINTLERLNTKMNPHQNYSHYRKLLKSCSVPCLPYLGVYLTDLIFIEEGIQDKNPGGLINFKKRRQMYNIIEEIQTYQAEKYNTKDIKDPIIVYLTAVPYNDEDELYRISLIREPRGTESKSALL